MYVNAGVNDIVEVDRASCWSANAASRIKNLFCIPHRSQIAFVDHEATECRVRYARLRNLGCNLRWILSCTDNLLEVALGTRRRLPSVRCWSSLMRNRNTYKTHTDTARLHRVSEISGGRSQQSFGATEFLWCIANSLIR